LRTGRKPSSSPAARGERGEAALDELRLLKERHVELMHLDLADLESIRAFAAAFARAI
jgi:hypothetical protein